VPIERHNILSFDLSLMYDFNTVDFQQTLTYTMIVEFQQCQGPMQEILYAFIVNNLDTVWHLGIFRKSKDLAISLQFHISSINKLFWSEYQDKL
jgi:hypothetical protein